MIVDRGNLVNTFRKSVAKTTFKEQPLKKVEPKYTQPLKRLSQNTHNLLKRLSQNNTF